MYVYERFSLARELAGQYRVYAVLEREIGSVVRVSDWQYSRGGGGFWWEEKSGLAGCGGNFEGNLRLQKGVDWKDGRWRKWFLGVLENWNLEGSVRLGV